MRLKYLRLKAFEAVLGPFSTYARKKRMTTFLELMPVHEGMSILDLGGQPAIWEPVGPTLELVILNVPGEATTEFPSHHKVAYVEGDACDVSTYEADTFEMVFSNSVIEHVGDAARQREFADEARRLGQSYWVQTPCKWFPIEAHNGMPFWWFYPPALKRRLIAKWRVKLPAWTTMVEGTRVLSKAQLRRLFPDGELRVERFFGLPKSYVVYHVGR